MNRNVGSLDRAARVVVGLGLIVAAATGALESWAYLGLVPLVTGIAGTCPLYVMLGMSTCQTRPD